MGGGGSLGCLMILRGEGVEVARGGGGGWVGRMLYLRYLPSNV